MSLNLAAIFGDETDAVAIVAPVPAVVDRGVAGPGDSGAAAPFTPAPIIPGHEHFNPWLSKADIAAGRWGVEFVPGHHVDPRQPSRLRGLLAPNALERPHP